MAPTNPKSTEDCTNTIIVSQITMHPSSILQRLNLLEKKSISKLPKKCTMRQTDWWLRIIKSWLWVESMKLDGKMLTKISSGKRCFNSKSWQMAVERLLRWKRTNTIERRLITMNNNYRRSKRCSVTGMTSSINAKQANTKTHLHLPTRSHRILISSTVPTEKIVKLKL